MENRLRVGISMDPQVLGRVFGPAELDRLGELADLTDPPLLDLSTAQTADVDVLVTGWGAEYLDGAVLDRMPRLRAVLHAAGSVKHHLDPQVWVRGIAVSSAVQANAVPVAEFAFSMILLAGKRVLQVIDRDRRTRTQSPPEDSFPDLGNYGKRVGLIGASRIGRLVIEWLRPTAFEVVVHDPYLSAAEADRLGVGAVGLDELVSTSDIVSVHAPDLPETHHLLDAGRIGMLKPGATLINTARAALIDHQALLARLRRGDLFAILDLIDPEPLPADSPWWDLPNVILTPHIAGSLGTELHRLADTALEELARLTNGLPLRFPVGADLSRSA